MRRLLSALFLLGIGVVAGLWIGSEISFPWPGLPRINLPEVDIPGVDIRVEPEDETNGETADADRAAISPFYFVLRDDQIYYQGAPIDEDQFRSLLTVAKEQEAVVEIEYDEATVTGSFVDEVQAILHAEEVQSTGMDR